MRHGDRGLSLLYSPVYPSQQIYSAYSTAHSLHSCDGVLIYMGLDCISTCWCSTNTIMTTSASGCSYHPAGSLGPALICAWCHDHMLDHIRWQTLELEEFITEKWKYLKFISCYAFCNYNRCDEEFILNKYSVIWSSRESVFVYCTLNPFNWRILWILLIKY